MYQVPFYGYWNLTGNEYTQAELIRTFNMRITNQQILICETQNFIEVFQVSKKKNIRGYNS